MNPSGRNSQFSLKTAKGKNLVPGIRQIKIMVSQPIENWQMHKKTHLQKKSTATLL